MVDMVVSNRKDKGKESLKKKLGWVYTELWQPLAKWGYLNFS